MVQKLVGEPEAEPVDEIQFDMNAPEEFKVRLRSSENTFEWTRGVE
jgi:hypothetical protein